MKLSAVKIIAVAVVGVFIVAFMPYLIGSTFMKPQSQEAKIMIDTVPVQLSSGIFYNDYFFSILGTSYLTYQLLAAPLGYSSSSIASGMYSEINPQWQYVALAFAITLGLVATVTSKNLMESAIGIFLGYATSSVLQLYLAENLLASLSLSPSKQAMAFNAILAFLTSSNFVYLALSLFVSFIMAKYVFPPKAIPLQEKKITLASEVATAIPKKEEKAEIKPVEEVVLEKETKTQVGEVAPPEVTTELKKEEKPPEEKPELPEELFKPIEQPKIEEEKTKIQAPEIKVPEQEQVKPPIEEKEEEVIELPEELFEPIEQPKIDVQEVKPKQVEATAGEEIIPLEESMVAPSQKEEKITKEVVEEKVYEKKREPSVVISELEKPIIALQERKYSARIEDKLKVNLYCNICGFKLIWDEEKGRYECPVCGTIQ